MNGPHLKAARLKAGWSLSALADALSMDKGYLSRVENGERRLTIHVAYQSERVMELDHDSLVRYSEDLSDTVRAAFLFPGWLTRMTIRGIATSDPRTNTRPALALA